MNRDFDVKQFQFRAGILSEGNMYQDDTQRLLKESSFDGSTMHHRQAMEDFEAGELPVEGSGVFRVRIFPSRDPETHNTTLDALTSSSYYNDEIGWYEDRDGIYIGPFDSYDEADDELNNVYHLLTSSGLQDVRLEVYED